MRPVSTVLLLVVCLRVFSQPSDLNAWENSVSQIQVPQGEINIGRLQWLPGTHRFWMAQSEGIMVYDAGKLEEKKIALPAEQIKASGMRSRVENIVWSADGTKLALYTNSKRVWRANTRGDYWFFDEASGKGRQIGKGLPESSLMFAKFSPDGQHIAYVSKHNIYVEDLESGKITELTTDGTDRIINGTFDWVYEEELDCRDGFRWSPDSKNIAYWRVDATAIRNHLLIDNTDSLYPFVIPVEYPKAGEKPSSVKIGVVDIVSAKTTWLNIPGDPQNNYLSSMDWAGNEKEILVVQLNRKQNMAIVYLCGVSTDQITKIYTESDDAWVDVSRPFGYDSPPWTWIDQGRSFLWTSEKDGWRHIYKISRDGKKQQLLTRGKFDADIEAFDQSSNILYFIASPYDATQRYLYQVNLKKTDTVRVTPAVFDGTNRYRFSPDAKYATHTNGSIHHAGNMRLITAPDHKKVYPAAADTLKEAELGFQLEKIKVKTEDGVELDGILAKPNNFDPSKKYPVFFYVYGEPAATIADDLPSFNHFISALIPEGYIGIALDNRGTPALKGREWRKSIYRKIGVLNSRDQAMAARQILKWPFIDTSRVAVHGWSGGGAVTLNLLFRYPEIYKMGIAISAISDQHFYDNIYTERYMGLPQENEEDYVQASPVTFAKNLRGQLLYIHGTGDDNVHYKNAEVLFNELIKQDKLFSIMIYPNRTHSISEGEGTTQQLTNTFLNYARAHCPPGGR